MKLSDLDAVSILAERHSDSSCLAEQIDRIAAEELKPGAAKIAVRLVLDDRVVDFRLPDDLDHDFDAALFRQIVAAIRCHASRRIAATERDLKALGIDVEEDVDGRVRPGHDAAPEGGDA